MKIRYLEPDPRAGMVVEMDSSLGAARVDAGVAEYVSEPNDGDQKADAPKETKPAITLANKNAKPKGSK